MITAALILFVTLGMFMILISKKRKSVFRLPPGPRGLPLLGNLLNFDMQAHLKLHEWALQYGKMFTVHLCHVPVLVINDTSVMKDILGRTEATGRYQSELLTMTTWNGSYGVLTTEGKVWLEQKQFCLRALKQFGFGRLSLMEPIILQEVDDLSTWIDSEQETTGKVVLTGTLQLSVGNALLTMIAGEPTDLSQSNFVHLSHQWVNYIQLGTKTGLAFFPWLKYFAPNWSGYNGMKKLCKEMQEEVERHFDNHRKSRVSGEPPRDMIDAYIDQVENCKDPQSTFYGEAGWKHSFGSVVTLMIAGTDGTGINLHWLIFYLSVYPEVQRKLQEEIDGIIGRNRNPCFADKAKMPYLEAVILETLRFASQTTIGGTVSLLEGISFDGYHLPKGMMLISNLYHVHRDVTIWGDPGNFRPERFLESGGDRLKEFVVAFHPGKRACPGEWFAKNVLFLYMTKLFQKYTFSVDPSVTDVAEYVKPLPGFLLYPQKLAVVVSPRN